MELRKSMARQASEAAGVCLDRLRLCLLPLLKKIAAGKKGSGQRMSKEEQLSTCPKIFFVVRQQEGEGEDSACDNRLHESGEAHSISNSEFWPTVERLVVSGTEVHVLYNVPTVTHITPPTTLVVGVPASCSDIQVMFSSTEELEHEWRRKVPTAAVSMSPRQSAKTNVGSPCGEEEGGLGCYETLSTNKIAVPTEAWMGHTLTYRCRPRGVSEESGGFWVEVDLPMVQPASPPQPRWAFTAQRASEAAGDPNAFRVVSYNILHDAFASTNYAKYKLYPFATEDVLSLHNRKVAIARELMELRGDVVCLQECGATLFDTYLKGFLESQGYEAVYMNKCGKTREGCATAFRMDRFERLHTAAEPLVMDTLRRRHAALAATISAEYPHLEEALDRVTSVGTVTLLKDRQVRDDESPRFLAVANTHLFYHPDGCHIRAIQAYLLLHLIRDTIEVQVPPNAQRRVAVVVCGDFNFTRTTGGYQLMSRGHVEETNTCWEKGYRFWWNRSKQQQQEGGDGEGAGDEDGVGATDTATRAGNHADGNGVSSPSPAFLQGPPTRAFSKSLESPFPGGLVDTHVDDASLQWTNYSISFKEIIDHIFIDGEHLRKLRTVPMPPESEVSRDVAIPSRVFPSDHLPLIADVTFTTTQHPQTN